MEAALVEVAFDPERIRSEIIEMLRLVELVRLDDRPALRARRDQATLRQWAATLRAAGGPMTLVVGDPEVRLVEVVNHAGERNDRVTASVRVRLRRHRPPGLGVPREFVVEQRLTLARAGDGWILLNLLGDPGAETILDRELVPVEWADERYDRELALLELARANHLAEGELAGAVSPGTPPRVQLLELAQLDGRFDPQLIELTLIDILERWEQASLAKTGARTLMPEADDLEVLLRPAPEAPYAVLVIRDQLLQTWRPAGLDLKGETPTLRVDLQARAIRYLVTDPGGRHLAGSLTAAHTIRLTWTLHLTRDPQNPWQLAGSAFGGPAIPGAPPPLDED